MMAIINGSPSAPARAKDFGVPPTPSQIGNWWEGSWLQKNLLFDGRYRVTAKHADGFVDTSYLED